MKDLVNHKWTEHNDKLTVRYEFPTFSSAIAFVVAVGRVAELVQHHPEIHINYCSVELSVCTLDEGSVVTTKDYELAREIDRMYVPYSRLKGFN